VKLAGHEIQRFIAKPRDDIAAVLVFGQDGGLIGERAAAIARAVLGSAVDDPFQFSVLDGDALAKDPARLPDEAAQLSLLGGRRVVRVRDAGDSVAKPLAAVLALPSGGALVVVEAGDLAASSSLRKLAEAATNAVAIACYPDGPRELEQLIREMARERRIRITDDALDYLVRNLGGDRLQTRRELEKLLLFAGDGGGIGLDDAVATVGDTSALATETVIYHAFDGETAQVENGLARLFLEGESPVAILRAAQRHAQRLHLAAAKLAAGEQPDAALKPYRLNFKQAPRFKAQLGKWPAARLARALALLTQAELDCKTTGMPDQTICRHLLSSLARRR
jgi:DNA polymerase-3 subunit delta